MLIGAVAGSGMGFACGMIPLNAAKEVHREGAGLASLVVGMMKGMAKLYATPVQIRHDRTRAAGHDHDEFVITYA